ncbi:ABC transporter ATP-binding protein [Paenimyroides baculatum]|uniref:ABC transporter ATP-binding protein n=1 Tax=Paenimyroides baculatum TaxID=2608000 RepID=A0A5M6CSG7_9FLAO|nr:ABC transporter ATP-binding protein [Paenimyroides baculatum]KAA5538181.1 ABC transporter ATP-binding protein [Paenimyroides baculatum]
MKEPILRVENLSISFLQEKKWNEVIHSISFEVYPNEIVGIVGESGSGKSVSSLAVMGLLPKNVSDLNTGSIHFKNEDITNYSEKAFQKIRGKKVSMIFQEPMSSLNPSINCGEQVAEILETHTNLSEKEIKAEVLRLFDQVKLPDPITFYNKYPHQISGGQKQRVMIAMAIACKPEILIADEPTTALDVTVQQEIILLLKNLQQETGMSILFISHDLSLISEICDRILVMYKGEIVEQNSALKIFKHPEHIYTKALIASRPALNVRLKRLPTIQDYLSGTENAAAISQEERKEHLDKLYDKKPLLRVENVEKEYLLKTQLFKPNDYFKAVDNVSFKMYEGETLGLVGESGCGKSTLGNAILQLDPATKGQIFYRDKDITKLSKNELKELRKEIQIIFQDPFASLNPKITVGEAILEPMKVHKLYANDKERKEKVLDLLNKVGLLPEHYDRYPHEFSGGQRQRIGIARTIAVNPKLIICDESVSALDISVQAQVLNLLNDLKDNFGFTYLFISHDLAVVKYISDQIIVMNKGKIEEQNEADALIEHPKKPYTQKLINAIPKGI